MPVNVREFACGWLQTPQEGSWCPGLKWQHYTLLRQARPGRSEPGTQLQSWSWPLVPASEREIVSVWVRGLEWRCECSEWPGSGDGGWRMWPMTTSRVEQRGTKNRNTSHPGQHIPCFDKDQIRRNSRYLLSTFSPWMPLWYICIPGS